MAEIQTVTAKPKFVLTLTSEEMTRVHLGLGKLNGTLSLELYTKVEKALEQAAVKMLWSEPDQMTTKIY